MAKVVAVTAEQLAFITALMGVFALDDNGNIIIGGNVAPAPAKKAKKAAKAEEADEEEETEEADEEEETEDADEEEADEEEETEDADEEETEEAADDEDADPRDEARAALKKVMEKKGKPVALALLKKLGATSITDLAEKKIPKLIESAKLALKTK